MLTLSWRIVEAGSVVLEQPPPWGFGVCVEQDWDAGRVGPVENHLGDSWEGVGHSSLGQIQDLVVHMVGSPGSHWTWMSHWAIWRWRPKPSRGWPIGTLLGIKLTCWGLWGWGCGLLLHQWGWGEHLLSLVLWCWTCTK